jgi:hypothetical protein
MSDAEQPVLSYTYRQSILTKPWTFTLSNDAMSYQEEGGPVTMIAYSQIKQIKPRFDPTRVQLNRYVLEVLLNNGRTYKIASMTYEGISNFKDQAEQYRDFVKAFHQRLANANSTVTFKKGISGLGYVASISVLVFLIFLLIIAVAFILTGTVNVIILAKLIFLIFGIPTLIRYIRRNKPATYDPNQLSKDIVPGV